MSVEESGKQRLKRSCIVAAAAMAIAVVAWMRPQEPAAAPSVQMVSLQGERLALTEMRGKVVLVNFWATDCSVCMKEMPAMVATYRKYQSHGLEAIFVAMPYDRPDHVLHYALSNGLPKVALDVQGIIVRAFGGIEATPTTLIVDKQGRVVKRILGEPDFSRLHALIERKLKEAI